MTASDQVGMAKQWMRLEEPWIDELQDAEEWEASVASFEFYCYGYLGRAVQDDHPLFRFFPQMREEALEARVRYLNDFLGWK